MKLRTAISVFALSAGLASGAANAATFIVDSTADAIDVAPGDGVCLTGDGECTLRAAVMEANATPGADLIDLTGIDDPLDPVTLTIDGVDETFALSSGGPAACVAVIEADASVGDLDITEDVTIAGAGPALTVIRWDAQSVTDPNVGDRIFHVQANPGERVNRVVIRDLTVTGGSVGIAGNLDSGNPYNCSVAGTTGSRTAWQFRRFGGGIAVGAGAAVVRFEEAVGDTASGDGVATGNGDVGAVELSRVAVMGNWSGSDAGGMIAAAEVAVLESVFSGNESLRNGGALRLDAAALISGTLIGTSSTDVPYGSAPLAAALLDAPNVARLGGGVYATGSHTSSIVRSTISGNTASDGGGAATSSLVTLNLSNTTVSGNAATNVGGGITTNALVNLANVTLANNTANSTTGGGAGLNSFDSGAFTFRNTLLSNNTVGAAGTVREANCGCTGTSQACPVGRLISAGFNLGDEAADTCALSTAVNDQLATDPLLGPLTNNGGLTETHRLPATTAGDPVTSPAVDAAANQLCPNNDQRGRLRPEDGDGDGDYDCDVGAFEVFIARSDLNIGNVAAPDQVEKGDTFQVVVEIRNDDAGAAAPAVTYAATVTPVTGLSIVAAAGSVGSCVVTSGSAADCALGDMAVGATATVTLTLSATAQGAFTLQSVVANDPSLDDPVPGNNTVTSRISVEGQSDIELSVRLDRDSARIDSDVTFDFTVSNNGPDDASNVRLRVAVPSGVNFFSASYSPVYRCGLAIGELICQMSQLAVGEAAAFRLIVRGARTGDYVFPASVAADQDDPDASNNTVDPTVTILAKSSGGGGGGCAYNPGAPVDPTLPGLLLMAVLAVFWRRRLGR
jgi:uncharacterized repeat protein (TIGR01451 family)/CSLREA domain-containing protein